MLYLILKDARKVHQLGEMGASPGPNTDVTAPDLGNLATAVLQSTVNTIPRSTMCRWACRNGVSGCGNTEHA
ncbi:MAG: hypothetical protein QGH37_16855 [Candidatus Poribacteria bacterium]|nr:hypothetical protein [Candidatus Poribacteria bacterium]